MVAPLAPLLIFEVVSLKHVAIVILVLARPVLQALLEIAFEEDLVVAVQLAFAPETIFPPLARVFVYLVEPVTPVSASFALHELPFVNVSVVVGGLPVPVRLRVPPAPIVLFDIVVFARNVGVNSLAVRLPLGELALID